MPRKSIHPLQKVTFCLRAGDYDKLAVLHPALPVAQVIREIVHGYILKIEATSERNREEISEEV